MADRPWTLPLTPTDDQHHVADFLGLDAPGPTRRNPSVPRVPRPEVNDQGMGVVSKIPEVDRLYQVQTNLIRLDAALTDLEQEIDNLEDSRKAEDEARRVRRQLDNSYRTLRTWLKDHG
jgi:hypothetical protein